MKTRKKRKTEMLPDSTSTTWLTIIWKGEMVEINGKGKIRKRKGSQKYAKENNGCFSHT